MSELPKYFQIKDLYRVDIPYLQGLFQNKVYPWEILPEIGNYIQQLLAEGLEGYTKISENVMVGKDVKIAKTATIEGKVIIGSGTEIRPGAFIRGNVITGENCVIGNSSELKNCILMNRVQVPHYNYVGDSILGNYAHMGAGSICSNLRSDGKNVTIHGDMDYQTGLRKIGAFIGDHGDIGCGSVLNPGTVIGQYTTVYPLTMVRGVIPSNVILKSTQEYVVRENRD